MPDVMMGPRVGVFFNYASGDGSQGSGTSHTFNNLFPTNHNKYGRIDFMNWQNMYDIGGNITVKPVEKLTALLEYPHLGLAEEQGAWYGSPRPDVYFAAMSNIDGENSVGDEIDLTLNYDYNKYVSFEGGYSILFHGELIRRGMEKAVDKLGGPVFRTSTNETNWGYLQALVHF